jgi:hypothetical protein
LPTAPERHTARPACLLRVSRPTTPAACSGSQYVLRWHRPLPLLLMQALRLLHHAKVATVASTTATRRAGQQCSLILFFI